MSFKIEDIIEVLNQNKIPATTVTKIVEDLRGVEEENKSVSGVKQKNKFGIVLRGPIELRDKITVGWLVQTEEKFDLATLPSAIESAKIANNSAQKRKKNPISGLADFFVRCKVKFMKEFGFKSKSKQPIQVVWLD